MRGEFEMKKKAKIFLGLFICTFMVIPFIKVDAIYVTDYFGDTVKSEEVNGVWNLTLQDDSAQDLIIRSGETVVLDLNNHTLTNYANANSAVWVQAGGTLTIKGTGTISKIDASGTPTVNNQGTLIVENGTISAKGTKSAALHNSGNLTVNGGTITTEEDNVFGLVNEGTAVINGGNFIQAHNFSVLNNANKMEIKGGNFAVSAGNTGAYSLITNQGSSNSASLDITGGTFKANNSVFFNEGADTVSVSGGSYSHDVSDYLADGLNMKLENGEYVLVKEEATNPETPATEETKKEEMKNPETSDNILVYGVLALAGLGVITVTSRKLLKH